MSIYLGNIEPKKYFVGDKEAKSVWIGGTKVWSKEKFDYGSFEFKGKTYRTIIIGDQEWMVDNLSNENLSSYGIEFERVVSSGSIDTAKSFYYKNPATGEIFEDRGLMYSGLSLDLLDNILDEGWKVPSAYDFKRLLEFVTVGDTVEDSLNLRDESYENGNNLFGFGAKRTDYRGITDYEVSNRASYYSNSIVSESNNTSVRSLILDLNSARISGGDSLFGGRFIRFVRYVNVNEPIHVWDGSLDSSLDMSGTDIYIDTPEKFAYFANQAYANGIKDKNVYITKDLYFNEPSHMMEVCKNPSLYDGSEKNAILNIRFGGNFVFDGMGHKLFGIIKNDNSIIQFIPINETSSINSTFKNISFECLFSTNGSNSQVFRFNTYDRSSCLFNVDNVCFKNCYFKINGGSDTYVPFYFRRWPNSGDCFYITNILFENNIVDSSSNSSLFISQTRSGYTPNVSYAGIRYVGNSGLNVNVFYGEGNRSNDSGVISLYKEITSLFKKNNVGFV